MLYECWEIEGEKELCIWASRAGAPRRSSFMEGKKSAVGINVVANDATFDASTVPPLCLCLFCFLSCEGKTKRKTSSLSLICEVSIATLVASMISSVNFPTDCLTK